MLRQNVLCSSEVFFASSCSSDFVKSTTEILSSVTYANIICQFVTYKGFQQVVDVNSILFVFTKKEPIGQHIFLLVISSYVRSFVVFLIEYNKAKNNAIAFACQSWVTTFPFDCRRGPLPQQPKAAGRRVNTTLLYLNKNIC